ncbi:MAG: HAD hydrolase family protein [Campylobacteraceae bacterium]|nr:HAD hydrolase family protein [Campylobacteraceae bacterium]
MIELIVLDVDGCLTDGKIYYTSQTEEIKAFNVKDGLGINSWIKLGKKVAIITGRNSDIVKRRSDELGITHLYQGIKDKKEALNSILKEEGLEWSEVAGIGDDWNDVAMLKSIKWSFSPKDAAPCVLSTVHTILTAKGGKGAVREMIEMIIDKEGLNRQMEALWL